MAKNKEEKKIMFSMTSSIQNSTFAFFELDSNELNEILLSGNTGKIKSPVVVTPHKGVGTISHYLTESDYKKAIDSGKKSPENGNPVEGESAFLSPNKNILAIKGSIKFINNFSKPSLSDSKEFRGLLKNYVEKYSNKFGYEFLMKRYLQNLVSGRAFWRNAFGFNKKMIIELKSSLGLTKKIELDLNTANVDVTQNVFENTNENNSKFNVLVKDVAESLKNHNDFVILDLTFFVELGNGAEVFPSQVFAEGSDKKGRQLSFHTIEGGIKQAILHPQKVGNGLRTIDTWYADYESYNEAIPVEAFGVVLSQREARRPVGKGSFFDTFDLGKFDKFVDNFDKEKDERLHYVMAMFIKGGVLGVGGKE